MADSVTDENSFHWFQERDLDMYRQLNQVAQMVKPQSGGPRFEYWSRFEFVSYNLRLYSIWNQDTLFSSKDSRLHKTAARPVVS